MSGVIRGAAALAFGSGTGAILSFVLALIIGRGWGQVGLGVYTAALAWMTPLSLITEAGLGTLFVRDLARHPEQTSLYTQVAIRQRVMVGGGLALCLSLAASFISDDVLIQHGIRYSAPLIMILPLYATFTALLRLQGRMTLVAALNIGMLAAQVSLTALLWQAQAALEGVLLVNTLTSGGQCALAAWLTQDVWDSAKHKSLAVGGVYVPGHTPLGRMSVKDLMERGLAFAMAAVIAALQMRLIVIMLEQTTTAAEVGLYAAAFKGLEIARLLALAVFDALFPTLSSLVTDRVRMQRVFMTMCLVLTSGALVGTLLLTALAPLLIPLLYGEAFMSAVPLLQILAWGMPLLVLRQSRILYGYALCAEQRVNALMLLGVIGQMIAAFALIPSYGVVGAAWTFIVGEAWGAAVLWLTNLSDRFVMQPTALKK